MTHTQDIAAGSTVLVAWDANQFINLTGADLTGPHVTGRAGRAVRLDRWAVVDFSGLTGSYSLVAEGTTGPRFVTCRRYLVPVLGEPMSIELARRLARAAYRYAQDHRGEA
jgi:hypothetical protein